MRSLRIAKICNLVMDELIRDFYHRNSWIKALSYDEHKKALIERAPVHLNGFSQYMRELGHECEDFVYDLRTLQKRWADENDALWCDDSWQLNILLQQLDSYRPDVIYLQDHGAFPFYLRTRLKDWLPYLKKVVMFKGFPSNPKDVVDIDLLFAGIPSIERNYRNAGIRAVLAYHSWDPLNLDYLKKRRKSEKAKRTQLSFIGYSGYGGHGIMHMQRYRMLRLLLEKTEIKMWITEKSTHKNPEHSEEDKPLRSMYPDRCFLSRLGTEMHQLIEDSKIVFNKHTEAVPNEVGNMRMFETTGVGSCLLSDNGDNLANLFEADSEVVTYSSEEECIEKINYLLNHDDEREAIAAAGQKRCLIDHSLAKRCEQISHEIQQLFD